MSIFVAQGLGRVILLRCGLEAACLQYAALR